MRKKDRNQAHRVNQPGRNTVISINCPLKGEAYVNLTRSGLRLTAYMTTTGFPLKVDSLLSIEWQNEYDLRIARQLLQNEDETIVITGLRNQNFWLMCADNLGNQLWETFFYAGTQNPFQSSVFLEYSCRWRDLRWFPFMTQQAEELIPLTNQAFQ